MSEPLIAPVTVRAEVNFRDIAGTLYDPGHVRFRLGTPSGTVQVWAHPADVAIERASVGVYRINVRLNAPGVWSWRWEGDGDVAATSEGSVSVNASRFMT